MNMLISLLICAVAIQISSAAPTSRTTNHTLAQTSAFRKRYQIFDTILIKINNATSNQIITASSMYPDILKDYNEWLLLNKEQFTEDESKIYEDLKQCFDDSIKAAEMFKKNRQNCEFEREMQKTYFSLHIKILQFGDQINHQELFKISERHSKNISKTINEQIKRDFYNNLSVELNAEIGQFVQSLDEVGKEGNKDIIEWYHKFQLAKNSKEIENAFVAIQDLYAEELKRETEAGEVNCRLMVYLEHRGALVAMALVHAFKQLFSPKSITMYAGFQI